MLTSYSRFLGFAPFYSSAFSSLCRLSLHTLASFRDGNIVMTQQQRGRGDDVNAIQTPSLIQVPIGDSGEHVSIDPHNLSQTNVEDILGVLQSELAPLRVWLECAKAYLAEDNEEAFLEIVGSGCSPGARFYRFIVYVVLVCLLRLLFDELRSDVDDRFSPTFADTFSLSFSLSLFEQRQH